MIKYKTFVKIIIYIVIGLMLCTAIGANYQLNNELEFVSIFGLEINFNSIMLMYVGQFISFITLITLGYIFLSEDESRQSKEEEEKVLKYLELLDNSYKKVSDAGLGKTITGKQILYGEEVLLGIVINAITIKDTISRMTKVVDEKKRFEIAYNLFNEWAKYVQLATGYIELHFITFNYINKSNLKETYLPIYKTTLTDMTLKVLTTSFLTKLKKDEDFHDYIMKNFKTTVGDYVDLGNVIINFFKEMDEIKNRNNLTDYDSLLDVVDEK